MIATTLKAIDIMKVLFMSMMNCLNEWNIGSVWKP
jgi:hypothetical protein